MLNNKFATDLIAPCGINCAICRAYIAYTHGIPRVRGKITYCAGCLPRDKNCYIKRGCKKLSERQIQSCSKCDTMPCEKLAHLDKRYRERYGTSMVENLKQLKSKGIDEFLKSQAEKYTCPNCGDVICVHDAKCLACDYKRKP
jgi:predicted RNA-binding Zn-ribbon protein involved in translation (DUF1610 family)